MENFNNIGIVNESTEMDLQDTVDMVLENTTKAFGSKGIQLDSQAGFESVIKSDTLFESYKESLTNGLSARDKELIGGLLDNSRSSILTESTTTGVQPVASLSGPTIRKMFPKIGLTHAFPTKVAKSPRFMISYLLPYILGDDGEQYPLPEAILRPNNGMVSRRKLDDAPINVPADAHDLFTPVGASRALGDAIDLDFRIVAVNMSVETEAGGVEDVRVETKVQVTSDGHLFARVEGEASDGNVNADTLTGAIDLKQGLLSVSCTKGLIKSVEIEGYLTSENNLKTTSVGFEVAKIDVEIPTAEHIDTQLPLEFLEDVQALYGINGKSESVDLMSKLIAQKTDLEAIEFIDEAIEEIKTPYEREFDLHPPAMFKGRPKEWLEELKSVIDFLAAEMIDDTRMDEGYFTIIGNPLDTRLLPNVSWTFTNGTMDARNEVAGVGVNYKLGAISGDIRYQIISSPNVPKGKLRMIFIPTSTKTRTFEFYPYSYHVIKDNSYRSPKMPNVPSIMMTKRHKFVKVMPLAASITITNNDGVLPR